MEAGTYISEIAKQGFGYMLAVVSWIVTAYLYVQNRNHEEKLTDSLNQEKADHLNSVKELNRENRDSLSEMNQAHISAVKEATTAISQLKEVANSTYSAVQFILNGRGSNK